MKPVKLTIPNRWKEYAILCKEVKVAGLLNGRACAEVSNGWTHTEARLGWCKRSEHLIDF